MIGQPPANIPCAPAFLNLAFYARPAAAFGLSSLYASQVGSRLRNVLRRLDQHADPVMREDELGEDWRSFLGRMVQNAQRSGLRGLAAWCDRRDIPPERICNDDLLAFCAYEFETRLFAGHANRAAQLARTWRAAVAQQDTPSAYPELGPRRKREAYVPSLLAFPASFQADMAARAAHLSKSDGRIFSGSIATSGPARAMRPATIGLQEFALRQAAAALIQGGISIGEIRTLRDLVSPPERPAAILDHFYEKAGRQTGGQLGNIAETLRQVAKHHARLPEAEWQHLQRLAHSAAKPRGGEGMTAKVRQALRVLIQPENTAMMLHLPDLLLQRAKEPSLSPREQARLARTAIMVDILTMCPLRLRNLQGLRWGEGLVWMGHGKQAHLVVMVAEGDSKNGDAIEWPLPAETSQRIRHFVEVYRPILAEPGNPYLLPGTGQDPLSKPAIQSTMQETVATEIGIHVHPHLMRHFGAWHYLDLHPGAYEIVRRILGHRRIETTIQNYCGLETQAAAVTFQKSVAERRQQTELGAAAAFQRRGRTVLKQPRCGKGGGK
ncbi:MAG: site-specific integrase [Roseococcus sp.]